MSVVSRVFHKNVSKMSAMKQIYKLYISNSFIDGRTRSHGYIRCQKMKLRVR